MPRNGRQSCHECYPESTISNDACDTGKVDLVRLPLLRPLSARILEDDEVAPFSEDRAAGERQNRCFDRQHANAIRTSEAAMAYSETTANPIHRP